jgi:hypothetical protein
MSEFKFGCSVLSGVILAIIVVAVSSLGFWGFRVFFADEIGRGNAEIQIQSAPSRIVRYESFYNQCNSIVALEVQIDREAARIATIEDEAARQIAETTLSGLYGQRARGATEYNADASKDYTSAQFMASDLPYHIDPAYDAGEEHTPCGI